MLVNYIPIQIQWRWPPILADKVFSHVSKLFPFFAGQIKSPFSLKTTLTVPLFSPLDFCRSGRKRSSKSQFREILSFLQRQLKSQIILSKIMPTRRSWQNIWSAGVWRGFKLTEKFPWKKQVQIEQRDFTTSQEFSWLAQQWNFL